MKIRSKDLETDEGALLGGFCSQPARQDTWKMHKRHRESQKGNSLIDLSESKYDEI